MKISITPISTAEMFKSGKTDIGGFIEFCANLNVDGVDLLDTKCYPWLWQGANHDKKIIKKKINDSGLVLAAYATGNNFAKKQDEDFRENVKIVKNAIHEAAEFHAPLLRIFGGYHQDCGGDAGVINANGLQKVIRGIEECLPEAEKCDMILALENHGRIPGHSYEIKAIIEHFNSPYLKCMFDFANFIAGNMDEKEDPFTAYENLKDYIVHTHVKDFGASFRNDKQIHGYIAGKGFVPLRQFIAKLEADKYKGFCSLEYEGGIMIREEYGVPESIGYLRQIKEIHRILSL